MKRASVVLGGVGLAVALVSMMALLGSTGWGRSLGGRLSPEQVARAEKTGLYQDGHFVNPVPTQKMAEGRTFDSLLRMFTVESERTPRAPMPVQPLKAGDFAGPPAAGLEAIWLGHATTLLEVEGMRVLTDPMLSELASPSDLIGPSRYHRAPLALESLPKVDVAVVSHDHYDHLDMVTVQTLASRGTVFVVPLGIGAHLRKWEVPEAQLVELTWWEQHRQAGLTIMSVPARHYSGRSYNDQDGTLWSGWVIRGATKSVYYSGDTGPGAHFAEIGEKLGPFDLTLIKIGEYDETWPEIHINPEEAVQAHVAVKGQLLLPVHWGTFNLAYHAWDEPIRRVVTAAKGVGVSVATPKPGERVMVGGVVPTELWWESVK